MTPDWVEKKREYTTTPFDRMQAELQHTPFWHFRKRKQLREQIATVDSAVEMLFK